MASTVTGDLGSTVKSSGSFGCICGDVVAVIVEDLLGRGRNVFWIGFERGAERREIGEALFFRDDGHLRLDAIHLAETELMYLVRRHVGGGPRVDVVLVALLAVGQRGDREHSSAFGGVFRAEELSEVAIRREDLGVDGIGDLLGQALLVFGRNIRWVFFCG